MQSEIRHPESAVFLRLINQLFEAEKKAAKNDALLPVQKNLERMKAALEELGWRIHNPAGEPYNEGRTDCEASIAGNISKPLFVTEVLKPIIFQIINDKPMLIQKAVVIVDNK